MATLYTTISQIGLALRFARSAAWIRKQGKTVRAHNGNDELETWERLEYADARCAGYRLVSVSR